MAAVFRRGMHFLFGVLFVLFQACGSFDSLIVGAGLKVIPDEELPLIPPSPAEKLTLVGWYFYKQPKKVALDNRLAEFSQCAPVPIPVTPAQLADPSFFYATPETYCYEPSGANGMTLPNSHFNLLTDYIFQLDSAFQSVAKLDDLFPSQADRSSDNECFKEALFYYALSYLIVPKSYDFSNSTNDIKFSVNKVDDGLQLISNGQIAGRAALPTPANFSLHKGQSGNLSALKPGPNTIVALWVDDCKWERYIIEGKITNATGDVLPLARPNVVNGYVYSKSAAIGIANITIEIRNDQNILVSSAITDQYGFYQVDGLPDGNLKFNAIQSGSPVGTKNLVLNHKAASTAVVSVHFGL
jgi:hypothetical protein